MTRTGIRSRTRTSSGRLGRATEEPGLERLQTLLAGKRPAMLGPSVPLAHREVVFERRVRLLERVLQLVAFEEIVGGLRGLAVAQLRIDDPADRPHGAGLPLDPHDDA